MATSDSAPASAAMKRPSGRPSVTFTPEALAEGRRRYEQTDEMITSIAAALGTSRRTLQRLASEEGWVRYVAPPHELSPAARLEAQAGALAESAHDCGRHASSPPLASLTGGGECTVQ
jgi:hypothetical protein